MVLPVDKAKEPQEPGARAQPKPFRFTVEPDEKAAFAGVFQGRVELLSGEVVQMPAMKRPPIMATSKLHRGSILKLTDLLFVVGQSAIRAVEQDGELEPGNALSDPKDILSEDPPNASDAISMIEVSVSSDRKINCRSMPGLECQRLGFSTSRRCDSKSIATRRMGSMVQQKPSIGARLWPRKPFPMSRLNGGDI